MRDITAREDGRNDRVTANCALAASAYTIRQSLSYGDNFYSRSPHSYIRLHTRSPWGARIRPAA